MEQLEYLDNKYVTAANSASMPAKIVPSFVFYCRFVEIVVRAGRKAKRGVYDDHEWFKSSFEVFDLLEKVGIRFQVTGIEHIRAVEGPCVIIGNHMSMMETVILPIIIGSSRRLTYIIKESLLHYPVFKHVMRSREPIAVTRSNPRQDLVTVMEQGMERLGRGISVIVFPQTTRTTNFDPTQMSSIGVKLAKKAGVPVVPVALRTSAWNNGKLIKDIGKIDNSKQVFFSFAAPFLVTGKGIEEHQMIINFIQTKLAEWNTIEG